MEITTFTPDQTKDYIHAFATHTWDTPPWEALYSIHSLIGDPTRLEHSYAWSAATGDGEGTWWNLVGMIDTGVVHVTITRRVTGWKSTHPDLGTLPDQPAHVASSGFTRWADVTAHIESSIVRTHGAGYIGIAVGIGGEHSIALPNPAELTDAEDRLALTNFNTALVRKVVDQ